MKKVFNSHSELAHIWAQQKQENGISSNMFFEGTRIFSYGHHYCIANFIKPNLVLINSRGYSNTTSKHHSHVYRALSNSVNTFTVPSLGWSRYDFQNEIDHSLNIEHYKQLIESNLDKANKAIKSSNWLFNNALFNWQTLESYCNTFEIENPVLMPVLSEKLAQRIENQREKETQERIRKELFEQRQNEIILNYALPAWLNNQSTFTFEDHKYQSENINNLPNCYLKVKDNEVITSKGAKVPLKAAKVLFDMIQSGKDIKGFNIGNYTVIGINGVLTIGCHKIERDEITRFAKTQNWI
jgi:hypothetical protein